MELPHLTLYLRRLHLPLGARTWTGLQSWPPFALTAGLLCLPLLGLVMRLTLLGSESGLGQLLVVWYAAVLGGLACLWGYWAGAAQMQLLWSSPGPQPVLRDTEDQGPEWFHSQLSDSGALAGILLSAALSAVPPLLGGAVALVILYAGLPMTLAGHHAFVMGLTGLCDITRLPHFLLAAGCLILAFRTARVRVALPLLCGATVAVHWVVGCLLLGYENLKNAANDCPLWITAEIVRPSTISQMGPRMIMMQIYEWLGVPLLVLLLWFGLRDAAQRRVQTGVTRGLVALMFAGPHLGTIYAGLQTLLSRSEPWQHDLGRGYLQAAYYFGATLTAMPGAWLQVVTGYDKLDGLKWLSAMQPMGLVWEVLIWAGMLLFWWRLGLKTLHDVRSNA